MKPRDKALSAVQGSASSVRTPAVRTVVTAAELAKAGILPVSQPPPRQRRALSPPPRPTAKQVAERAAARARHEGLKQLGESLRQEREALGLSLEAAAQRCGINRAALSKLELGQNPNPTLETLWRYAAALGKRVRCELLPPTE